MELKDNFDEVYRELYTPIFKYTKARIGDMEDAKDLVQDVFLKFFSHNKKFEIEESKRYLWASIRNRVIDWYRKIKPELLPEDFDIESEDLNPEEISIETENAETIKNAMIKLSQKSYDALYLRYFEEKDFSEMAEILSLKEDNIRKIISRAKKELKDIIDSNERR